MALESLEERKPEEEALAEEKGEKGGKGSFEKDQSVTKRWSRGSAEKKEKDPFTPVSNQPTREWKSLERYSVPETGRSSGTKPLSIERVLVRISKSISNTLTYLNGIWKHWIGWRCSSCLERRPSYSYWCLYCLFVWTVGSLLLRR